MNNALMERNFMSHPEVTVASLIDRFWIASERGEWTPKTDLLPLAELKIWMLSADIEVLGFVYAMIHDHRFRIEPPLPVLEYVPWAKHYYERCFRRTLMGIGPIHLIRQVGTWWASSSRFGIMKQCREILYSI